LESFATHVREFKVERERGKRQIAYRETITTNAHGVGKLIKQSGGRGQSPREVDLRPAERSKGLCSKQDVGGIIPRESPAIRKVSKNNAGRVLGGIRCDVECDIVFGSSTKSIERARFKWLRFPMKDVFAPPNQSCSADMKVEILRGRYIRGFWRFESAREAFKASIARHLASSRLVPLANFSVTRLRSLFVERRSSYSMEPSAFEQLRQTSSRHLDQRRKNNGGRQKFGFVKSVRSSNARSIAVEIVETRNAPARAGWRFRCDVDREFRESSPHVDKKSMNNLKSATHKRCSILSSRPRGRWMSEELNLHAGVDITIKIKLLENFHVANMSIVY